MDELTQEYLDRVKDLKSKGTYTKRKSDLSQFNEWTEKHGYGVAELETRELDRYLRHLNNQGYAPNTIAGKYDSLFNFYERLAGLFDVREENPMEDLKRDDYFDRNTEDNDEDDIRFITPEEKETLAEHVPASKLRNELMIRLLWQTGIRQCELVRIKLDDIDREGRSIYIWSPKTKSSRTVFYQPSLDFLMKQWLDRGHRSSFTYAAESDYLFVTRQSAQFRPENVNDMVRDAAEKAGIQEVEGTDQAGKKRHRITGHALRHGHARHALKSGIDVRTVQEHLGHTSLEITKRYLQLLDEDVKDGYQRFDVEA